ncbi:MAG: integrase core domain protein [Firmicutes bacterium]|nr:integrase core domain protein [Bacillota bacterium]
MRVRKYQPLVLLYFLLRGYTSYGLFQKFILYYSKEIFHYGIIQAIAFSAHTLENALSLVDFTGSNFQTFLRAHGTVSSVSRKGNPYDNAIMESFYRTIKREFIQDAHFGTPEQDQQETLNIFNYTTTQRDCTLLLGIFPLPNLSS